MRIRNASVGLVFFALLVSSVASVFGKIDTEDPRADQLLKQAREAVGGEGLLQSVETLYAKGKFRRPMGEREMSGERELSFASPDRFQVEDSMEMPGMPNSILMARTLNGEQAWSNNSSFGGGGGMVFSMRAGGGGAGGHGGGPGPIVQGGPPANQPSPEEIEKLLRRQLRIESTRYLLAFLLNPSPAMGLEYKYAGEAVADDGQADVLEITGPENFAARLFLDKQTHLPLMLSYRGLKPQISFQTVRSAPHSKPADPAIAPKDEAQKQVMAPPPEVDIYMRLSDYKKVNGMMLPHRITRVIDGEVNEEFEISKFQINPQFKADKFQKK